MNRILIYCANGYGERVAYSIGEDYEIIGFTDVNPGTWGTKLAGLDVKPIEEWKNEYDYIVIATSEFSDIITDRILNQTSISREKIIVFEPADHGIRWNEERVIQFKKCAQMLNERGIPGNCAELGVYRGDFSRLINQQFQNRKLYLFDTFEGFDAGKDHVADEDKSKFKDTSEEFVLSRMPYPDMCIVKKGYFPETAIGIDDTFAFVSLDCDLYEPIIAGLRWFYPRMEKGGYIFVHDFGSYHYTGVKKAVYEFCSENDVGFLPLVDRGLSAIIVR